MKIWKNMVIFYFGGMLYLGLELLWRGWSHGSMFVLGGLCFLLIGLLDRFFPHMPVLAQMLAGTGIVLAAELYGGLILNCWLGWAVWDYSQMPFNYLGQICLPFALLWFPVSGAAILVEDWLRKRLFGEPAPRYRWV